MRCPGHPSSGTDSRRERKRGRPHVALSGFGLSRCRIRRARKHRRPSVLRSRQLNSPSLTLLRPRWTCHKRRQYLMRRAAGQVRLPKDPRHQSSARINALTFVDSLACVGVCVRARAPVCAVGLCHTTAGSQGCASILTGADHGPFISAKHICSAEAQGPPPPNRPTPPPTPPQKRHAPQNLHTASGGAPRALEGALPTPAI